MRLIAIRAAATLLLIAALAGCAGPAGLPPLLGPGLDGVLPWAVVLVPVVVGLRGVLRTRRSGRLAHTTAAEIVRERYARGELSADQCRAMLDELNRHGQQRRPEI